MRAIKWLGLTVAWAACGGGGGGSPSGDGGRGVDGGSRLCAVADAGAPDPAVRDDEFAPNAPELSMGSPLARTNVYEATSASTLVQALVFARPTLPQTRLTLAVHEAPARNQPFRKVAEVQVEAPSCAGWVGTGPLSVAMVPGRFYAVGFDPNQEVLVTMVTQMGNLPIEGASARLIGSKTGTSVSLGDLGWSMLTDGAFYRQRLQTVPGADVPPGSSPPAATVDAGGVPSDASRGH